MTQARLSLGKQGEDLACREIRRRGYAILTRRYIDAVEFATLAWVDWFNTRRLLQPIGYIPPAEYEERYYEQATVA